MKSPANPIHERLGKRAPKKDPRTLQLRKYLRPSELPTLPKERGYSLKVDGWPMYLNDQLGDCVIAASGHMIEQWTAYAKGRTDKINDKDVLKAYEDVGGYQPGKPWTDNGCVMLDALNYWRKKGIGGHKIIAYAQIDPLQLLDVAMAVYLFGNVYAGFAMPLTALESPTWEVPEYGPIMNGSPGSWGGHCVPLVGYSYVSKAGYGLQCVSWGEMFAVTWNFMVAYADELYAVVTQDWIDSNGYSPSGFDLKALLQDLGEVTKRQ